MSLTTISKNIFFSSIVIFVFSFKSATAQPYIPGNIYYDSTGFVEYRAGNLPIIISAPHGGSLQPDSIPDRECTGCSYINDAWTKPIAEGMYDAFFEQTGCYPHVIINLLHRSKFDANRDIDDAADGNATVEQSWYGYHEFIDSAKVQVIEDYDRGLFVDIHGHSHTIQRIELGYLLSGAELRLSDATLNTIAFIEESAIRTLVGDNIGSHSHSELLRSEDSFGTLMDEKGFPSVPSLSDPFPNVGELYFNGGYNTQRHGSRDNAGDIDAIQIELNQDIRFNAVTREILIDSMTTAINQYLDLHYNDTYIDNYCDLLLPIELARFEAFIEDDKAVLNWATLTELDNDYFEIQRKSPSHSFTKIGRVKGNGNSLITNDYQYLDLEPKNGTNYYRLKQIDYDGSYEYSNTISLEFDKDKNIIFFPNPSQSGIVNLKFDSTQKDELIISVYDVTGRLIINETKSTFPAVNQLELNFSSLSKGVYFVKIENNTRSSFLKLFIQ